MLKLRLQRVGRVNDPSFRVVVTNSQNGPKSGKFLEVVGTHNPKTNATTLEADRITYWLSVGAQASGTLHNLLITKKIIEGKKINVLPRKSPIKSTEGGSASGGKEGDATAKETQAPAAEAATTPAAATPEAPAAS